MRIATTDRQEDLLRQLTTLFLNEGFRDLTLDDLTLRLRCSKTTLYVLGGNKEQLVITIVVRYFRESTELVEQQTAAVRDPAGRIIAYLDAIAASLRRASPIFMDDISSHYVASAIYERNTAAAADRIRELIAEGVTAGVFRPVHGAFVADVITATMERIQTGRVRESTGLRDTEAFEQLTALVLQAIRS